MKRSASASQHWFGKGWCAIACAVFMIACKGTSGGNRSERQIQAQGRAVKEAGWKMGVALYSFNRHPLPVALLMVEKTGAKYMEGFSFYNLGEAFNNKNMGQLDGQDVAALKKMMAQKSIKMTSMYVDGAKNVHEWEAYFKLAAQFQLSYIVCEPAKAHWDMIDSLAGIYKMKVAIHQHAKGSSAYWHPDSVLAAIRGHANIGACADLGHWARSGLDPADCLKILEGHIAGIHLKDIDEKGNPAAKDVDPGTGVIDFAAVVKELKRQKFTGFIQVECEHNFDDNVMDVREAIQYIHQLNTAGK